MLGYEIWFGLWLLIEMSDLREREEGATFAVLDPKALRISATIAQDIEAHGWMERATISHRQAVYEPGHRLTYTL
jgi:hypothetical protein